jgi:hypothetical protein
MPPVAYTARLAAEGNATFEKPNKVRTALIVRITVQQALQTFFVNFEYSSR